MKLKSFLTEEEIYIGAKVKILRGKYKGQEGVVDDYDEKSDQVDVKINKRITRYLGANDVKIK